MGVAFLFFWQRALALTAVAGRLGQLVLLSPFLSMILIGTVLGEHIHLSALVALGMIVAGLSIIEEASRHGSTTGCVMLEIMVRPPVRYSLMMMI